MRANPRQTTPPVTMEPAHSKPKITNIGNSPHIPQETLILDEFVKPPGSVWWGGTKSFSFAGCKMAWIAVHVFKPRGCFPCLACLAHNGAG